MFEVGFPNYGEYGESGSRFCESIIIIDPWGWIFLTYSLLHCITSSQAPNALKIQDNKHEISIIMTPSLRYYGCYAGLYVYEASEWEEKGISGADLANKDLKEVLEGLAKHLFGDVEASSADSSLYYNHPCPC